MIYDAWNNSRWQKQISLYYAAVKKTKKKHYGKYNCTLTEATNTVDSDRGWEASEG